VKLDVTSQAISDLQEIEEYIGKDNALAAVDFVQRLTARFYQLVDSPGIGRKRDDLAAGLRSSRVGDHLIFYLLNGDKVVIVHVLHGARDLPSIFKRKELL
jgi:toxin ParE1/3/4